VSKDQENEIRDWLEKSGYPLEMEVARTFRKNTILHVDQSWHYIDPTTGDLRQADVVANIAGPISFGGESHPHVAVFLTVECKSTTAPWVVLKDQPRVFPPDEEPFLSWVPHTIDDSLLRGIVEERRNSSRRMPIFDFLSPGYEVCEKRNTDKGKLDPAYAAVRQAASAAFGILGEVSSDVVTGIAIPVVVTKSPLFEATLNGEGEVVVRKAQRSSVEVRMPKGHALVHIVSSDFLRPFVEDSRDAVKSFLGL
jgi:hypothetical protein